VSACCTWSLKNLLQPFHNISPLIRGMRKPANLHPKFDEDSRMTLSHPQFLFVCNMQLWHYMRVVTADSNTAITLIKETHMHVIAKKLNKQTSILKIVTLKQEIWWYYSIAKIIIITCQCRIFSQSYVAIPSCLLLQYFFAWIPTGELHF